MEYHRWRIKRGRGRNRTLFEYCPFDRRLYPYRLVSYILFGLPNSVQFIANIELSRKYSCIYIFIIFVCIYLTVYVYNRLIRGRIPFSALRLAIREPLSKIFRIKNMYILSTCWFLLEDRIKRSYYRRLVILSSFYTIILTLLNILNKNPIRGWLK